MKKIFFSLLAIAAIASCAKTDAVYEDNQVEIKLAPVTALQTKANVLGAIDGTEYPTAENFDVYGYWKKDDASNYTDGESYFGGAVEFTNKGAYWGGVKSYYWPKNGTLRFAAYSPADLDLDHSQEGDTFSGKYVQPSKTAETWDFLVAPTSAPYTAMTAAEHVSVVFEHALSWITLKVKAKDAEAENVFTIKKVTINGVNTTADFKASMLGKDRVDYESWSNWGTAAEYLVFDGAQGVTGEATVIENTAAGTLVIPQATTNVTVTFDQKGVNGTMDMTDMVVNLDLVLDQDNEPWRPGYHYTYTLVFGLDEILINPSVSDWEDVEVGTLEPGATNVSTAAQLEAALANPETTKIVFQNDIAGQFNVPEAAKTLTIDGNGYKFDGTFNLVGNSSYTNGNTVFENINFETADASALTGESFIYCAEQNGNTRYPDSVTINNCTFTATGAAEKAAVGAKFRSLKGVVAIEGTTATGMHSLLQMLSCGEAEVAINDVTIENGKNGISLQYASGTISNTAIEAAEYGVRADGANATLNVVKSTIKAEKPIIVRKLNAASQTFNLALNKTTLEPGQTFAVVFTNGNDDAEFVAPKGKFNITGADDYVVFPTTTATQLMNALAASAEVELVNDVDLTDVEWTPVGTAEDMFTGVLNGNGHTITGLTVAGDYAALIAYAGENAVVKDVTFENVNVESTKYGAAVICVAGNNVTVENVTVSGTVTATSYAAGLVLMNNEDSDKVIIKNCVNNATVTSKRAGGIAAWVTGGTVIENVVNNGDITGDISACGITNRIAGTIKNAKNYGKISGNGTEPSAGIAGTQTAASTFEYCYNYGDVTTVSDNANASAAGILGQTPSKAATLNYCANYGTITAEQSYAAGIAYSLYGNINASYCYNAGNVKGAKAAGAIAPKAQYGANDTAKYCLNAGTIESAGKVYQGSNKNTSCYYYNAGTLMNVADNAAVAEADALVVLNGGADADFFALEGGVIVVK